MPKSLLLSLFLFAGAAAAADGDVYTLRAQGEIVIGTDGSVAEVALRDQDMIGATAVAAAESVIRRWRFEPVTVDGRPARVRGEMQLVLQVAEIGAGDAHLSVRDVWFNDHPNGAAPAAAAPRPRLGPPRYPSGALRKGVGGDVQLIVKLDAAGAVVDVAARNVELLGRMPLSDKQEAQYTGWLVDAAIRAARDWSIPGYAGGVVLVPVRFFPAPRQHWILTRTVDVERPAWVVLAEGAAVELGQGGQPAAAGLRLQSALDDGADAAAPSADGG